MPKEWSFQFNQKCCERTLSLKFRRHAELAATIGFIYFVTVQFLRKENAK